jgi:hypothetical protein
MAKLLDSSRVYGSIYVDTALISLGGFMNMETLTTVGSGTYYFPPALHVTGAKFKVTIVAGGGGGGAGTTATSGMGGGGGSGGVSVCFLSVAAGLYSFTYTVGAAGTAGTGGASPTAGGAGGSSQIVYNGVTYTCTGGSGGPLPASTASAAGGTASVSGNLNINGFSGGSSGTHATTIKYYGIGADTPLGFGNGGVPGAGRANPDGSGEAGTGYGSGGGGADGITVAQPGGAGAQGIIIIEY